MPSISQNNSGGVIRWDRKDWLSGLMPNFANSTYGVIGIGDGLAYTESVDPKRQPGYLSPGPSPTDVTTVAQIDALQVNGVTNGSKAYIVGGTKVHELNLTNDTVTNAGSFPHTVTAHGGHASVVMDDIVIYSVGGTKYAFYSWHDDTDGDIGRYNLDATFDDDFMSTVPTGGAALSTNTSPLFVGGDGILYAGDGNNVVSYDGTNFNSSALDLPDGYVITSFANTPNFLVIYAYAPSESSGSFFRTESRAFLWDYVSSSWTYEYDLSGNYVNGGFSMPNGSVGCFVQGRYTNTAFARKSKMMLFNGSGFSPVFTFIDEIPTHGGVEVLDDIVTWNSGGMVYQYGNPYIGLEKTFNRIAKGGGTGSGMLKNFTSSKLYLSSGTTTSGGLETLEGGYDTATIRSAQYSIAFPSASKARVKKVRLFYGFNAASGNRLKFTLLYDRNKNNQVLNGTTVAANALIEDYLYDVNGANFPEFSQIGWEVNYTSVSTSNVPDILEAVEIYFQPIKL